MTEICTLTLQCDDRPGLVADVAGFLAQQGGNITDAQQFNDKLTDRFFMRVEFEAADDSVDGLRTAFTNVAQKRGRKRRQGQTTEYPERKLKGKEKHEKTREEAMLRKVLCKGHLLRT